MGVRERFSAVLQGYPPPPLRYTGMNDLAAIPAQVHERERVKVKVLIPDELALGCFFGYAPRPEGRTRFKSIVSIA